MNIELDYPVFFTTKKYCCGCAACCDICSQNAIEMIEDEEGFLYPVLIKVRCAHCKQCLRVCPLKRTAN